MAAPLTVFLFPVTATFPSSGLYIGLMSGTSLDGVDGVIARFDGGGATTLAAASTAFPGALRAELMDLQAAGHDEIHREALAANGLADCYADCVAALLSQVRLSPADIRAVGVHGQTIRHRPELGYTRQTNNPALLAERTGIDVVSDFRSRDIAAGGQGAPLVPAFHAAVFGAPDRTRVVANIGGIANISILEAGGQRVTGYDTGPGNVLIDGWIGRHRGAPYDADGAWARSGCVNGALLAVLRSEPYFSLPPPKSTGRDLFHMAWLDRMLAAFPGLAPADVQATLTALTATTLADAIVAGARDTEAVYVCGGGAHNGFLMELLQAALRDADSGALVYTTEKLGIAPNRVEALAFAWLARRFIEREPGNLALVTGARGPRILGALYPA